jgi:hypothetical protein
MRSMRISVQQILTRPMSTSRLACNSYRTVNHLQLLQTAPPLYPGIFTLKPTSPRQFMDQPLHNGVHPNPSSLHKAQLHQHWQAPDGIDLLLRSVTPDCPLSS